MKTMPAIYEAPKSLYSGILWCCGLRQKSGIGKSIQGHRRTGILAGKRRRFNLGILVGLELYIIYSVTIFRHLRRPNQPLIAAIRRSSEIRELADTESKKPRRNPCISAGVVVPRLPPPTGNTPPFESVLGAQKQK